MSDKQLVIALRLPDVNPTDLSFSEIAELMKQMASLFKNTETSYGYIQNGSSYFGGVINNDALDIVKANILSSIDGDLDKFISKHANWGNADIGMHYIGEDPKEMTVLRSIKTTIKKPEKFKQPDTLRGYVKKLTAGKDATDHVGIAFLNETSISAKTTRDIAIRLANFYGTEILLELTGQATYSISDDFEMILEDFKIDSFEQLPQDNLEQWIDDFVGYGESNWQSLDDPIATLGEERAI